jgi:hypothetical protein
MSAYSASRRLKARMASSSPRADAYSGPGGPARGVGHEFTGIPSRSR